MPIDTLEKFAKFLMDYDSDTFNAKNSSLEVAEAFELASNILARFVDDYIDGNLIDNELAEIRSRDRDVWLKEHGRTEKDVMYDDDNQDRAIEIIYSDENKKITLPEKYQLL